MNMGQEKSGITHVLDNLHFERLRERMTVWAIKSLAIVYRYDLGSLSREGPPEATPGRGANFEQPTTLP